MSDLWHHGLYPPGSSVHGISQGRILEWVVISYFQGIFLTQGSNPSLLCLLHWQVDSLPLSHQGSPTIHEASLIFKVTSENSKMINCLKTFLGAHIFSSNTRNASGTAGQVDHPDVVKSMHSGVCLTSNPGLPFNSCRLDFISLCLTFFFSRIKKIGKNNTWKHLELYLT